MSFNDLINCESTIVEEDFILNNMSVKRINKDSKMNDYGYKLLNLCSEANLCVLNGRAFHDKDIGEFTYCNKQGKSVIDYVLCNKYALYNVCNFNIYPFNCFSDHSFTSFNMKINMEMHVEGTKRESILRAKWDENKKGDYISKINSEGITKAIENITGELLDIKKCEGIDNILEQFSEVIKGAGSSHIKEIKVNTNGKKGKCYSGAKWYDEDCKLQNKKIKEIQKKYFETWEDIDRVEMCEQRSIYRNLCREKKRDFNQKEADRLVNLSKKDPRKFWREIKGNRKGELSNDCNFFIISGSLLT